MARALLGKTASGARRQRVYENAEALDIDDIEDYDVRRRRLFYDEIELVTYHRHVPWSRVVAGGLLLAWGLLFAVLGWRAAGPEMVVLAGVGAAIGVPSLAILLIALLVRVDTVTVYGKRTWARMDFVFRKQAARDVHQRVCLLAREHQSAAPRAADLRPPFEAAPGSVA
jgi:ribosomal protein S18 acetylase RimI-like enzyme